MIKSTDKILIDIDCLFDLRLAAVFLMDPELAVSLAFNEKYLTRINDNLDRFLPGFDQKEFERILNSNDSNILADGARPTRMFVKLIELVNETRRIQELTPGEQHISITVNTYPFNLTDIEIDTLQDTIHEATDANEVSVISLLPDFLCPSHIRNNYTSFICYNFNDWVTRNLDSLRDSPMPSVLMFCPVISTDDSADSELFIRNNLPQQQHKELFACHVGLRFKDLGYFSIYV